MSAKPSNYWSGWFLDLSALHHYFKVGFGIAESISIPETPLPEDEHKHPPEKLHYLWRRRRRLETSLVQASMYSFFPYVIKHYGTEEAKNSMILLHGKFYHSSGVVLVCNHRILGKYNRTVIFIPTGKRSEQQQDDDASDVDCLVLENFVKAANELIEDPDRRQEAGFKSEHFGFTVVPESSLVLPQY
ncbi:hypothetical protein C8Q78DRAFT_989570 [Trametes maxima]|nr:hypothetical protein C8Q78DRAFT_989570 [Trametes maxima]